LHPASCTLLRAHAEQDEGKQSDLLCTCTTQLDEALGILHTVGSMTLSAKLEASMHTQHSHTHS